MFSYARHETSLSLLNVQISHLVCSPSKHLLTSVHDIGQNEVLKTKTSTLSRDIRRLINSQAALPQAMFFNPFFKYFALIFIAQKYENWVYRAI